MKRLFLALAALALSVPLAGCGGDRPPASAGTTPIADRIGTLERRYRDVRAFVELVLPLVPADRAAQIHALDATVTQSFAQARAAASAVERLRALARAEAAIEELARD